MLENPSNAQSSKWWCHFEKLKGVTFKLQNITLPNISTSPTELGGRGNLGLSVSGDRLVFDDLQFDFLIDSNWCNYNACYRWLIENSTSNLGSVSDCTIHIVNPTSNINNGGKILSNLAFTFTDCFIINLQSVVLDSVNASKDLQCTLTLRFTDMVIAEVC